MTNRALLNLQMEVDMVKVSFLSPWKGTGQKEDKSKTSNTLFATQSSQGCDCTLRDKANIYENLASVMSLHAIKLETVAAWLTSSFCPFLYVCLFVYCYEFLVVVFLSTLIWRDSITQQTMTSHDDKNTPS